MILSACTVTVRASWSHFAEQELKTETVTQIAVRIREILFIRMGFAYGYPKIMVLFLKVRIFLSRCFLTARERTIFSRSFPLRARLSGVSL